MNSKIKIALIQLHPKPLSPDHNFARAESLIRSAAAQGAHLAVLPEYALTSWVPTSSAFPPVCRLASSRHLAQFQDLAAELHMAIVPGTFIEEGHEGEEEEDELGGIGGGGGIGVGIGGEAGGSTPPPPPPPPGNPTTPRQNISYFIASSGEIAGRYAKRNLWHPERAHLRPGKQSHEPFETELGRVGLLICWDLAFPEAMRDLVRRGARLVIVPSWWLMSDAGQGYAVNPLSEAVFLESLVVCRAFENTCAVVFVNAGGPPREEVDVGQGDEGEGGEVRKPAGELEYAGLSQVGMPLEGSMGKLGAEEGMSIVEIDMDVLDVAERTYKVREDLARDDWHYGGSAV